MSNLSDFFGGGGPSNIIRGSTAFATEPAAASGPSNNLNVVTINTGVFVDPSQTYITQGVRGDTTLTQKQVASIGGSTNNIASITGSASARINGSGEVVITTGIGEANSNQIISPNPIGGSFRRNNAVLKGTVDWEAVEYG